MPRIYLPAFVKNSRAPEQVGFYPKDTADLNEDEQTFVDATYDKDFNLVADDEAYAKAAAKLFNAEREVGPDYEFTFTQRDELTQLK